MKNLFLKKEFEVPIYDTSLWLVVARDAKKARGEMVEELGEYDVDRFGEFGALTSYKGSTFGVFFYMKWMREVFLSHELFHVTHRMLELCDIEFSASNHEPFCYLHGFLSKLVRTELKKAGIRVK